MIYDLWKLYGKDWSPTQALGHQDPELPSKPLMGSSDCFTHGFIFSCKSIFKKYPCFKQPVLPCSARDERRDRNKQKGANQFLGSQVGFPTSVDHSHAFQMVSPRSFPRHQTISIMVIKEMRWRPPAHPCPVASSFFITVFIACRRVVLAGDFMYMGGHSVGMLYVWLTVVYAMLLLLYMCTCACLWSDVYVGGGGHRQRLLSVFIFVDMVSHLSEYLKLMGWPMSQWWGIHLISAPHNACPPAATLSFYKLWGRVSELRISCLYSGCLNNWTMSW